MSLIAERIYTSSVVERNRLLKAGYAIVALSQFGPDGRWTYTLEKGSKWSRMLGSK